MAKLQKPGRASQDSISNYSTGRYTDQPQARLIIIFILAWLSTPSGDLMCLDSRNGPCTVLRSTDTLHTQPWQNLSQDSGSTRSFRGVNVLEMRVKPRTQIRSQKYQLQWPRKMPWLARPKKCLMMDSMACQVKNGSD